MGSVLGIERPYISSLEESAMEGNDEFCLEYGSATHLYLVPSTLQEERVNEFFFMLLPFSGSDFCIDLFFFSSGLCSVVTTSVSRI